jgi:hypothetical protein
LSRLPRIGVQIISLFSSMAGRVMPDISGFLSFFDFFSFDFAIEGWPGLSCAMGEDYYDRLLITMLTPLIMLVCVCLVSSLLLTLYKTKVNGSMLM